MSTTRVHECASGLDFPSRKRFLRLKECAASGNAGSMSPNRNRLFPDNRDPTPLLRWLALRFEVRVHFRRRHMANRFSIPLAGWLFRVQAGSSREGQAKLVLLWKADAPSNAPGTIRPYAFGQWKHVPISAADFLARRKM